MRRKAYPATDPFAIVAEHHSALSLFSVNAAAEALGLIKGMPLTDARASYPTLLTAPRVPAEEAAALKGLHRWAYQYSPYVALDGEDGLLLDVTGGTHLFGGEEALCEKAQLALEAFGFESRLAIAGNPQAARALARFAPGNGPHLIPMGKERSALAPLPVEIFGETSRGLRRLGLKTVDAVAALPRRELAKRFGIEITQLLDDMLGTRPSPLLAHSPDEIFSARMSFADPIGLIEDIRAGIERVTDTLCSRLSRRGRAARVVELHILHADGHRQQRLFGLARATANRNLLISQFFPYLEKLDAGFGIDVIRLVVHRHEANSHEQVDTSVYTPQENAYMDLIGRLGNRLGFDRITTLMPFPSHLPGKDQKAVETVHAGHTKKPWPTRQSIIPIWLTPPRLVEPLSKGRPPQTFLYKDRTYHVTHAKGPKRITGEWWVTESRFRQAFDYWTVQTQSGERFELASPLRDEGWYLTGLLP